MVEMPFRRRMRMRRPMQAPIVSYKHQRQTAVTYLGAVANQIITVFQSEPPGGQAQVFGVPAGNKVYSLDVSMNFIHTSGSGSTTINWMLCHLRDGQNVDDLFASTDAANWSNIGLSKGRNQVIKSFLSQVGTEDAGPKMQNIHIKIPKMWHRVREGDSLLIVFNASDSGSLVVGTRFKSFS